MEGLSCGREMVLDLKQGRFCCVSLLLNNALGGVYQITWHWLFWLKNVACSNSRKKRIVEFIREKKQQTDIDSLCQNYCFTFYGF